MTKGASGLKAANMVRIDWEPVNWFAATWRDNPPLIKTRPRTFDLEWAQANADECVNKFVIDWLKAPCDMSLCSDEALFWFSSCFGGGLGDLSSLPELSRVAKDESGKIRLEDMKGLLSKTRFEANRAHGLVPLQILDTLMHPEELIQLFCDLPTMPTIQTQYRKRVLPFLSPTEKAQLKKRVESCLGRTQWESGNNFAYYMAACLGMHDITAALVESWPSAEGQKWDTRTKALPQIVFGLGSAEAMVEHFKRLNLMLVEKEHAVAWVAHTEDGQLDFIVNCITRSSFGSELHMTDVIACVKSARSAEIMFDLSTRWDWFHSQACSWLNANLEETIEALITISAREGKRGDSALASLRTIRKAKGEAALREVAARLAPALVRRLYEEILEQPGSDLPVFDRDSTPDWLSLTIAAQQKGAGKKKLPSWLSFEDLPPVVASTHRLNAEQIQTLVYALQQSPLGEPPMIAAKLKIHADGQSLDRFAWFIFDMWLQNDGAAKENWALFSLAHLGSDQVATRLAQLIRIWPGESNHKRAVVGLECLRTMGSDVALMQINAIAEKMKFKALKAKAEECITAIAESRQLSRDRLGDRIIPMLGFERSGEKIFDYGQRRFIVTVGDDFKPAIVDEQGKPRADLPAPGVADDQDMAAEALADWKDLKKSLRDLYKVQETRLEQAMVLSRRWFADEFANFLLNHPLMKPLLRQFVWAGFDMTGQLKSTFFIVSRQDLRTVDGASVELSMFSEIGLVHPLHLSERERAAWQKQFDQGKIKQPFPQLKRPVQKLAEKEVNDVEILRARNYRIPATAIVGTLDRRGWQRGPVEDGGLFTEHIKFFPRADITAVIQYPGIPVLTGGVGHEDQHIDYCAFLPGKAAGQYWREYEKGLPLGTIDEIVLSEVLSDLELLREKGALNQ